MQLTYQDKLPSSMLFPNIDKNWRLLETPWGGGTLAHIWIKNKYFVIYGIISEFTDKGQFQYLTNLKGPQEGTYLYTTQFLSLR